MSLWKREDRGGEYWGYLRINGQTFRKSLKTKSKSEGEKLLFEWKQELMLDPNSKVSNFENSFEHYSQLFLNKQKSYPNTPSGIPAWISTKTLLNREKGLLDFFGKQDVRSITKKNVEEFVNQLPLNNKPLTTGTIRKHLNILKQVLGMADINFEMPRVKGTKSQPRGYFNLKEYKTLVEKSKELIGFEYQDFNGSKYELDPDLHDFIIFMVGSSLRPTVSEIYSLQHKHISHKKLEETDYLEFPLIRKNRKMLVQTLSTSYFAYRDLCERRKTYDPEDYVFLPYTTNRRTAMRRMSKMFGILLRHVDMETGSLGEQRSLYSLRHTSLVFNLSQPNVDLLDICRRSDTSMKMIEDFYYPLAQQDNKLKDFLRI